MAERSRTKKLGGKGKGRGRDDKDFKKKDLFPGVLRKKYCRFCKDKTKDIDYKNLNEIGSARNTVMSLKLDKSSDSVVGTSVVDKKGNYFCYI